MKNSSFGLTQKQGEILLALVMIIRGSSLLFVKLASAAYSPFTLLAIRFLLGFVAVLIIFHKQLKNEKINRRDIIYAAAVSILIVAYMTFEIYGLKHIQSANAGFIESTGLIFIPIVNMFFTHKFPDKMTLICMAIGFAGLCFLLLKGTSLTFSIGEFQMILCVISFSLYSVIVSKLPEKGVNMLHLGIFQLFFTGIYSLIAAIILEDMPSTIPSAMSIISVLYLAIIVSGLSFAMQPVAQSAVSADRAGLFTALIPLASAILGILFLDESLSITAIIGGILILLAVFLPSICAKFSTDDKE